MKNGVLERDCDGFMFVAVVHLYSVCVVLYQKKGRFSIDIAVFVQCVNV